MKKARKFKFSDILIGIVFSLLFISIGVMITINFRPLYHLDINLLHIEKISGYSKAEILQNYNALIDYSSPFFRGALHFPTLAASASGLEHFKEVKNIFTFFYILAAVTFIAAFIIILYKRSKNDINYLPVSAVTAVVLPLVIGLCLAVNFDAAFIEFHKLFFRNDYWIFDPVHRSGYKYPAGYIFHALRINDYPYSNTRKYMFIRNISFPEKASYNKQP